MPTTPMPHPVPTWPHVSLQNPGNWKPVKLSSCSLVLESQEVLGRREHQVLKVRDGEAAINMVCAKTPWQRGKEPTVCQAPGWMPNILRLTL